MDHEHKKKKKKTIPIPSTGFFDPNPEAPTERRVLMLKPAASLDLLLSFSTFVTALLL